MSEIAKHKGTVARAFLINPEPETGTPVPTEGLEVFFFEDGFVGFRVKAAPENAFCIGPWATLQLAELLISTKLYCLAGHDEDQTEVESPAAQAFEDQPADVEKLPLDPGV